MNVDHSPVAGQRVDRQSRPQRRTADADMDQVADLAQGSLVDGLGQYVHPGVERTRLGDAVLCAETALGGVLGGTSFGRIDLGAREQGPRRSVRYCPYARGNRQVGRYGSPATVWRAASRDRISRERTPAVGDCVMRLGERNLAESVTS